MFLCAISGTTPTVPVVSAKSGNVYEKALIDKYIDQNGTDPITGEGLTKEDLIEVKAKPQTLPPRAPTQTSIPTLLTSLQSEFDAIMLESLEVKKSYQDARQELANALYREDAATRALARIMKERDEARTALASVQATIGIAPASTSADAPADIDMSAPAPTLPSETESIITATHAALSSTRKKRKPAPGYATLADVKAFTQQTTVPSLHATKPPGITALDVAADGQLAVTGGADKTVHVYDFASGKTLATLKGHTKPVKQVALVEPQGGAGAARLAVSCSADKTVKVWSEADDGAKWSLQHNLTGHKGEVSGLAVHPSGRLVAAGSTDETWSLYDLTSGQTVKTYDALPATEGSFAYTSFAGHPDGILHGGGTQDGSIRIWDVRDASALAASLTSHASPVTSLSFSENGYYLASASATDPTVKIFDLRKLTVLSSWALPAENKVTEVRFDPSAQFLSVVGTDARVYANKTWEEVCKFDDNAGELTGARFVDLGKKLVLSGMDRTLRVLA
ncbi:hypothetical protein NliqN6_3956 [Naganishia liquefaciens]|uniref:Pre-mRNA-processing factor 19 n=1 Tax=Naganishia liquefaciens TaxID=104408 RepID=A0A8H3TUZ1_9TREE|nr:hypothetical protein NliqN6_3956 [Naganishia liquefaciens]